MADSWVGPDYLDGLKVQIDADVTIAGLTPAVNVDTHWPNPDVSLSDRVMLYRVRDNQEHFLLGTEDGRLSTITVDGQILVHRPLSQGSNTETINKAARDRATTILDRIVTIVNDRLPAVGTQVRRSIVENIDLAQYPAVVGDSNTPVRVVTIDFEITAQIRVD